MTKIDKVEVHMYLKMTIHATCICNNSYTNNENNENNIKRFLYISNEQYMQHLMDLFEDDIASRFITGQCFQVTPLST